MVRHTALACVILSGAACGAALGGYTVGGFERSPALLAMQAGQGVAADPGLPDMPAPIVQASGPHVCTGCDAGLHREASWRYDDADARAADGGYRFVDAVTDAPADGLPSGDPPGIGPDGVTIALPVLAAGRTMTVARVEP